MKTITDFFDTKSLINSIFSFNPSNVRVYGNWFLTGDGTRYDININFDLKKTVIIILDGVQEQYEQVFDYNNLEYLGGIWGNELALEVDFPKRKWLELNDSTHSKVNILYYKVDNKFQPIYKFNNKKFSRDFDFKSHTDKYILKTRNGVRVEISLDGTIRKIGY